MKTCPYCAEEIQDAAVVCKHCGRELSPLAGTGARLSIGAATPSTDAPPITAAAKKSTAVAWALIGVGFALTLVSFATAGPGIILLWVGLGLGLSGGAIVRWGGGFIAALLIGSIGMALTGGATMGVSDSSGRTVLPQGLAVPPPVVTKAEYDQIQEGMTYTQVRQIIGASGEELSRSDLAGISTVMYSWMNANGSNMNAMFQNDRLVQKAQFGLP